MPIGVYVHKRKPLADRFWLKVNKRGLDECWLWTGCRDFRGYGRIANSKPPQAPLLASHVSWEINRGPIPEGLWVLHKCDNPPCVNPKHLFLGTHIDNMRDAKQKGRNKPGGYHKQAACRKGHLYPIPPIRDRHGNRQCQDCLVVRVVNRPLYAGIKRREQSK